MGMEVTAINSGSVHVLRHSFQPSEHLANALENYLEPGVSHPRSLLYATRLITLNTSLHPAHEISIDYDTANREFVNRHHERVFFGRDVSATEGEQKKVSVAAKKIGGGLLRVALLPRDKEAFASLLSGFDDLPNDLVVPGGQTVQYYVHADLPGRSLRADEGIEENTKVIAAELDVIERARLFYVTPSAIERRVIQTTPYA